MFYRFKTLLPFFLVPLRIYCLLQKKYRDSYCFRFERNYSNEVNSACKGAVISRVIYERKTVKNKIHGGVPR